MGHNEKDNLVFFGAKKTSQEMDEEFKKLYDSLIIYKNNIFHLVDNVCNDCDAGERLAMNIAERDSALLQRLVAKECDQRRMTRKSGAESIIEALGSDGTPIITIKDILQARTSSLNDALKTD